MSTGQYASVDLLQIWFMLFHYTIYTTLNNEGAL